MGKKITITMVVAALLASATFFFTVAGGFEGNISQKPFDDVDTFFYDTDKIMYLIFEDVEYGLRDVWVDVNNVEIEIDDSLPGTMISATPALLKKLFGQGVFYKTHQTVSYKANSVTLWVQNEQERLEWLNFLNDAKKEETILLSKANTIPSKIIPPK